MILKSIALIAIINAIINVHTLKIAISPQDRASCKSLPKVQTLANQVLVQPNSSIIPPVENNSTGNDQSLPLTTSIPNLDVASGRPNKQVDTTERLRQLRLLIESNKFGAYLVGTNDEHGSEYVSDYDRRLRFISGFTGSNGFALITMDKAIFFTDGRYAIQAELELDCNWSIVVAIDPIEDLNRYVDLEGASIGKIATDARLLTLANYDNLQSHMDLVLISQDLIDVVWNNESSNIGNTGGRGSFVRHQPNEPLFIHPLQFAGNVSWQEKVSKLAQMMAKLNARHYIIGKLDNIAWLLNLRGSDIPKSPLFKSYLFISRTSTSSRDGKQSMTMSMVTNGDPARQQQLSLESPQVLQIPAIETIKIVLYIDPNKVTAPIRDHLHVGNETLYVSKTPSEAGKIGPQLISHNNIRIQVEVKDYESFIVDMGNKLNMNNSPTTTGSRSMQGKLLLDTKCNVAIHVLAKSYEDRMILQEGLIDHLKSVKSDLEVEGMRQAHWRDSLAISMLLAKLDDDIGKKQLVDKWTEVGAAKQLTLLRSLMDNNYGESFDTISAYGPNAAIIHYGPKESDMVYIGNQSTFLLDTGAQYLDGTTDITRTVHFGQPTEFQRETYTRVLMGAIDCMSLLFFQPTRSPFRISDLFIRRYLQEIGLDYAHGTGHGIGLFSLVHEAPNLIEHYQSVAQNRRASAPINLVEQTTSASIHQEQILLQPNMFTSVEPGFYKENEFGIRLENIVVTQKVSQDYLSNYQQKYNKSSRFYHSFRKDQRSRSSSSPNERQLLRFEPISLVPFEPKLIKHELLSNRQKIWLNSYNLLVRFRLTQQVNYYLAKHNYLHSKLLKQAATSGSRPGQQVQIQGVASSSRIYQTINAAASSGKNNATLHYGLESGEFREDLERTHIWILNKTQLIPLDHPHISLDRTIKHNKIRREAKDSAESLDARRLMLAYMSSMPFNDLAASEAIAALAESSSLTGRADLVNSSSIESTSRLEKPNCSANSSSILCDLSLVTKLSEQPTLTNDQISGSDVNGRKSYINTGSKNHSNQSDFDDDFSSLPETNNNLDDQREQSSLLNQWFGLDNNSDDRPVQSTNQNGRLNGTLGRWTVALLGSLLILQAVLTSYAFTIHYKSRQTRRRLRSNNIVTTCANQMHPIDTLPSSIVH